ncbi:MAG: HAD family hydrolase [Anaerolineaceae bacterium]|nr:HAD family hydrolase [Anaerolineaceae bacterium]
MHQEIDAIFLDIGNTLRILLKEEPYRAEARQNIVSLIGTTEPADLFCAELDRRYKDYRKWAFEHLLEASEEELWLRWLAPEFPTSHIMPLAHELTYQFRQSMGRRVMVDGCKEVITNLHARGYTLGIISNVITTTEIPDWLAEEKLDQYFKSILLSSTFGRRKPDPAIYQEAARRANVPPEKSAYVGDNFSRDVVGTRAAGFGMVIIMPDADERGDAVPPEYQPDLIINTLKDLLAHFPERSMKAN